MFVVFVCNTIVSSVQVKLGTNIFSTPLQVSVLFSNNEGSQTLRFSSFLSPFDTLMPVASFVVEREGKSLQYMGLFAKRLATAADCIEIPAGGQKLITIPLANDFNLSTGGDYKVYLEMELNPCVGDQQEQSVTVIRSNTLSFSLEEGQQQSLVHLGGDPGPCTSSETNVVTAAKNSFRNRLANPSATVANREQTKTPYTDYFGTFQGTAKDRTAGSITDTILTYSNQGANFGVSCNPTRCGTNVYAYVYPTDATRTIHFCSAFWRAPTFGFPDSQPGTIYHELSHFTVFGGTSDYAYGVTNCKSLARSNPNNAVKNADSYEYFSETVAV